MRFPNVMAASAAILAAAACADQLPLSAPMLSSTDSIAAPANAVAAVTLVGAGNVARCDRTADEATGRLLDNISGTVFTTGDNVFASGSTSDFSNCYGPSWGRHRARTRPAAGDLDYQTNGAIGYYGYFGTTAGTAAQGFYSYDLGDWHIVVLNSAIDMSAGSVQEQWLRADLASRSTRCTLAYWHHPRFSSYSTYVRPEVKPLWDALYEYGAELVLNGHYRLYERFAPQTPSGVADAATGIRQITVGTGGISTNGFGTTQPNSEVRRTAIYGVLRLTLATDTYQWQFVPVAGQTFSESGSGTCHGAPGARVAAVDVTPSSGTMIAGKTMQLVADARDVSGFPIPKAQMSWRSVDTLTAKVVAGLVTGIAAGTTYVIATSGNAADTASISVLSPVASVAVAPTGATVLVGDSVALTATVSDSAGVALSGRTITWSSNAPGVATVTAGMVRGVVAGPAVITATSEGKSASASVTVTAPAPPPSPPSPAPSPIRVGWYVSPGGSSANNGSYDFPWTLSYAMSGAGGRVQPGDTVWLRGGVYAGEFRSTVSGTATRPVVMRQYPGERAVLDGPLAGTTLRAYGAYTVFWGFEIMKSDPSRTTSSTTNSFRGNDVANYASHTKYVNLVVHDGGVAFYSEAIYTDVEIVGCIIYNNGWQGPDRGHGHALYLKSLDGPVIARDNVMFNQFGYGVHLYSNAGSGQLSNIRLEGNVAFNNGTLSNNSTSANILIGGDDYATNDDVQDNLTYYSPGISGKNVQVGFGTLRNGSVRVVGNYVVGGSPLLDFGYWTSAVVTGNEFLGTPAVVTLRDASLNLSLTGQVLSGLPTSTKVVVRPNPYEAGRGHIVVYNWGRQASVLVDLSAVLPVGAAYEIRNVQTLDSAPVVSGTYGGGAVTLPIRAVTPPVPVGMAASRAPSTGIDFQTYVVTLRN